MTSRNDTELLTEAVDVKDIKIQKVHKPKNILSPGENVCGA